MRAKLRFIFNSFVAVIILSAILLYITARDKLTETAVMFSAGSGSLVVTTQRSASDYGGHRNDITIVDPANGSMKVKLILLTYMRSGSSFTGDLFNHHPEAFYVYEPLWSTQKLFNNGGPAFFFNKTTVSLAGKKFYDPRSLAAANLKSFLDCNFYHLDPQSLSQPFLYKSLTTRDYIRCYGKASGLLRTLQCLPLLFTSCRQAEVTTVKTIRFTMRQAAHLMLSDPKVKVIHLIRDPRATLRSQSHVGEFKRANANVTAKEFCTRVLVDLKHAVALNRFHKLRHRVFIVRYEDLAEDPLHFANKLLAFAGLRMGDHLREYFWNITSAGHPDNCIICTTRNDSRKTSRSWRTKLDFKISRMIDKQCAGVYKMLGYLPLSSEEKMTNLSVPSLLEPSKVPGIWKT